MVAHVQRGVHPPVHRASMRCRCCLGVALATFLLVGPSLGLWANGQQTTSPSAGSGSHARTQWCGTTPLHGQCHRMTKLWSGSNGCATVTATPLHAAGKLAQCSIDTARLHHCRLEMRLHETRTHACLERVVRWVNPCCKCCMQSTHSHMHTRVRAQPICTARFTVRCAHTHCLPCMQSTHSHMHSRVRAQPTALQHARNTIR
jgi:hypothetical protein